MPHTREPIRGDCQDTLPAARTNEHTFQPPLDRSVPTSDKIHQPPNFTWADKERSTRYNAGETEEVSFSSPPSVTSSDEESVSDYLGHVNVPPHLNYMSVCHENPSDNTLQFSLDVTDDIESHLEEVSRLKRWGHFKEATEYFTANLKDHLDLPLVFLQYSDLLLEQGSYKEFLPLSPKRWWDDYQKVKCLPIGGDRHGPNLYQLHSNVLRLKAMLFCQGLSVEYLDLLQTDTFWEYLDKRTFFRHDVKIPFDSTEVQIICNQLHIRACTKSKSEDAILPAIRTCCWPQLYNDLLMDGRIWELSDLLRAMFRAFGIRKTFKRLFNLKKENESRKPSIVHCLEWLLTDWTMDEYDEPTELAILTILVDMLYAFHYAGQSYPMSQKDRNLTFSRCLQQADQCAAEIKEHSPHLTKSRPYLQWILAKEHFNRQKGSNITYSERLRAHIDQLPGFMLHRNLPSYIPQATENPGWPDPDPRFPPSQNLQWALEASKELLDYDTQAMLLRELICRARDPRLLFAELDRLLGLIQGNLLEHYESCLSQYLLATDKASCRELLERLKAVAPNFQFAPEDDLRLETCWRGLMVQNALARIISEDAELIDRNSRLAQAICYDLPLPQAVIDRFSQSTSADKVRDARRARSMQSLTRRQTVELFELRERNQDLERELRGMKLRLGLSGFEGEERPQAREEGVRTTLPGDPSNNCPGRPDDAPPHAPNPSHNHEQGPAAKRKLKSGEMDEKGKAENKAVEDASRMTKEPDKIDDDTHADGEKEPGVPQKPERHASVTEAEDEPTKSAAPSQSPGNSGQHD